MKLFVKKKRFLISLLLLLSLRPINATHIVGGEMNYTCLGDDLYEISLTIFRDCYNGDPSAWFDDPASIGVFNANNELLQQILIPLVGNDTLAPVLSGECLVAPPSVCVHTTTYRSEVRLPPIIGGYQLAYQRCCRNQTIANIVRPLETGATYGVTISEKALLECNSNPKFKEWPPIYICANEPISFDQSAVDQDGDSIVYRLCTPLRGANQQIPQPQPPNPPPYEEIEWLDPPYGVDNMLNGFLGNEPLRIDPSSGLLTGLPNTIGQFVVGICVEEYRDGALISTTRRDFQYNVGQCTRAAAAFFAPEIYCDGLTVDFQNKSLEAREFLWSFSRDDSLLEASSAINPVFTFPDTGRYLVELVANPNDVCSDTFRQELNIRLPSLAVDFDWRRLDCSDSIRIAAESLSADSISAIVRQKWTLEPGGFSSDLAEPEFVAPARKEYILLLEVETANGCIRSKKDTLQLDIIEASLPGDSVIVCRNDSIRLNPNFDTAYVYRWREHALISDPTDPNPLVFPSVGARLTVDISDPVSACAVVREIYLDVPPPIALQAPPDTTLCLTEWPLVAQSERARAVFWSLDREFANVFATQDTAWINPQGGQTYFVGALDEYNCTEFDSVFIQGNGIELDLPAPPVICLGDSLSLPAIALDTTDVLEWRWQSDSIPLQRSDTSAPLLKPRQIGAQTLRLEVSNQLACVREELFTILVLDTFPLATPLEIQVCDEYLVAFSSSHPLAPYFTWHFGDASQEGASASGSSVYHRYPGPGDYELTIVVGGGTLCADTLRRTVTLEERDPRLSIDYELLSCADTALVRWRDASMLDPSEVVRREWRIADTAIVDSSAFNWIARDTAALSVQLILAQTSGCIDTLRQEAAFPVLDLTLADTIRACPGERVDLNPGSVPAYRYEWSPARGLSDPRAANPQIIADSNLFYQLSAIDSSGRCALDLGVHVWVAPDFDFSLPSDTLICESMFTIKANFEALGQIVWSKQTDFDVLVDKGPEITIDAAEDSLWHARATDIYGCSKFDSIEVISRAISIALPPTQTVCIGDTLEIRAIDLNNQSLTYLWEPEEDVLSGLGTPSIRVSPKEDAEYFLLLTNEFGCTLDTTLDVRIFNYTPPLEVAANPDTVFFPSTVMLEGTFNPDYIYSWTPAQGLSTPDWFRTDAFVDKSTTYQLTVRDGNGCINRAALSIVFIDPDCIEPNIFVPDAFTPNGDQVNDVFRPRGLNIAEMRLIIYDRWGEKVFESNSPDFGWDGSYRGAPAPTDVYGYYLELGCANGQQFEKKGNVILLR